jgi:hypothetical protein
MGVLVWLLIPLLAVFVAILWTAWLARRERQRADEDWRAKRLAALGSVLTASTPVDTALGTSTESESEVPHGESVSVSTVELDLTDGDAVAPTERVVDVSRSHDDRVAGVEVRSDE